MILMPSGSGQVNDVFEVVRLLVRSGVAVRTAKSAIDDLVVGRIAYIDAPAVADYDRLKREMSKQKVAAHRIELRQVDVKALRQRLGISQEAF
ncbi:MAG TPA: hypothetical protein VE872_00140, partial [Candidatus Bathyarchaeia archaeon]|nr:hypothetical protein [Candidatus Bathyarchaeia archaeon]